MHSERLVIQRRRFAATLFPAVLGTIALACGGSSAPESVKPATSPTSAVESFMEAVADSNLAKMGALWGTAGGPAAKTRQPSDWERRVAVMQSYLRNESHRVVANEAASTEGRRNVQVELRRQLCSWVVPFVVIKAYDGTWLVNQVDLTAAGNPSRPCDPGSQVDSAGRQ